MPSVHLAVAALSLIGSSPECVRVGGKVRVGSGEGAVGTVVSIGKSLAARTLAGSAQSVSNTPDGIALAAEVSVL